MRKNNILKLLMRVSFFFSIIGLLVFTYFALSNAVPDNIKIFVDDIEEFDFGVPLSADFIEDNVGVISVNNKKVPSNQIKLNLNKPFSIMSSEIGGYNMELKLFGFIKFKEVRIDVIDTHELVPSGEPIGIYIETDGVMVLGTGVISANDGMNYEPSLDKVKSGDYIEKANGIPMTSKEQLLDLVLASGGNEVELYVRREKEYFTTSIKPVVSSTGEYRIGVWIRDNTQGIGTLTFTTNDGKFGALGHGITDIDTSLIMEIDEGTIYKADIMTIIKGKQGAPGELIGVINQSERFKIGNIEKNTNQGIYGDVHSKQTAVDINEAIPIGLKQNVEVGPATILSCVDNKVREYDIMIDKVELNSQSPNKGMVIRIIDDELIQMTGGIVQGMSGSPIIQNGTIIGAVTHVFIQDSTKGYGTFIENMIYNLNNN